MAYSNLDKYEMTLRQARVDIGMGRGNALSKAVDLVVASGVTGRELIESEIFLWADKFAEFNQKRIDEDYNKWFEENDKNLRMSLGLEKQTKTIEEEYYSKPNEVDYAKGFEKGWQEAMKPKNPREEEKKESLAAKEMDNKKES